MTKEQGLKSESVPPAPTLVKPVVNAMAIMRHLGKTGQAETVTSIARTLGINTSTCFNILRTLAHEGMLVFDERAKTYAIGLGIVQLAQWSLNDSGKIEVLRPLLQEMAERHQMTVTLWRFGEGDRNVLVSSTQATTAFQLQMKTGQRLPLYIGAFGRVLAGINGLSKKELKKHFDKLRWMNPPDFETYWEDTRKAAETGWAVDDGNFAIGVVSIAVAVRSASGTVRHGIVASMFKGQKDGEQIEHVAQDMLELADEMSGLF